jgi:regulator of sigma E protease
MLLTILIFIVILGLLVFVHEFGHFLMAKRAGIRVEEFGFGLPPKIWGKKIGDTEYTINWLPFGGFVRLRGEDPTDKHRDEPDSFYVKSIWQRAKVILAGVFANFVLGVVLLYIILFMIGFKLELPLLIDHNFRFVNFEKQVAVVYVEEGSPAATAGIKLGEVVLSIDDTKINSISQLQQVVKEKAGNNVKLVLRETGSEKTRTIQTIPRVSPPDGGPLGIALGELAYLQYQGFWQKTFSGFSQAVNIIEYSGKIFGRLIAVAITNRTVEPITSGVAGPIGIARLTSEVVSLGLVPTLQFAALLSLNLAVINVLPLPALDGGRLFFLAIEAVTRKKVYPKIEKVVHTAGLAILILLIVLITYNDVLKLINRSDLIGPLPDLGN